MSNFAGDIIRTTRTLPGTTGGVRAVLDVTTGEGAVAGAVAGLGEAISGFGVQLAKKTETERLREEIIAGKRQQMLDTRSAITGASYITRAVQENLAFRLTNADTSTWEPDMQERLKRVGEQIGLLDMSNDARDLLQVRLEAQAEEAMAKTLVAATRQEVDDTKTAVIDNLIEAVASGDKESITEATKKFQETMSGLVDAAEARETFKIASEVGIKKLNDKTKQFFRNEAAAEPDGTIEILNTERELRKTGRGVISKTALSDSDLEAVLDYASTVQTAEGAQSKLAIQQSKEAAEVAEEKAIATIITGKYDLANLIRGIQADPNITIEEDSNEVVKSIVSFATSFGNATKVPDISHEVAIKNMEEASAQLASGNINKATYYNRYADNKTGLSKLHQDKYLAEAEPSYSKMIGSLKRVADDAARHRIVTMTDADLIEISKKVDRKEIAGYVLNATSMKHQAEMLNYSAYQFNVLEFFSEDRNRDITLGKGISELQSLAAIQASKSWIDTYKEHSQTKELQRLEADIKNQYNAAANRMRKTKGLPEIKDAWSQTPIETRAKIIDMIANENTLEDVINAISRGQL